jgi:hypothetical protein
MGYQRRTEEIADDSNPPISLLLNSVDDLFKLMQQKKYLILSGLSRKVITASGTAYEGGRQRRFLCSADPG